MSGSIFVLDLRAGGEPRRISPVGDGSVEPRWSPDGTRILYRVLDFERSGDGEHRSYRLMVANAHGSGGGEIYRGEGLPLAAEWDPSGDAVYAVVMEFDSGGHNQILAVAADGSGRVTDLGGNAQDSILPPAEKAQTEAALADLREAIRQYEVGKVCSSEGRAAEAKAAFRSSADIFASLVWKHPLAGFGTTDLAAYADAIESLAH